MYALPWLLSRIHWTGTKTEKNQIKFAKVYELRKLGLWWAFERQRLSRRIKEIDKILWISCQIRNRPARSNINERASVHRASGGNLHDRSPIDYVRTKLFVSNEGTYVGPMRHLHKRAMIHLHTSLCRHVIRLRPIAARPASRLRGFVLQGPFLEPFSKPSAVVLTSYVLFHMFMFVAYCYFLLLAFCS